MPAALLWPSHSGTVVEAWRWGHARCSAGEPAGAELCQGIRLAPVGASQARDSCDSLGTEHAGTHACDIALRGIWAEPASEGPLGMQSCRDPAHSSLRTSELQELQSHALRMHPVISPPVGHSALPQLQAQQVHVHKGPGIPRGPGRQPTSRLQRRPAAATRAGHAPGGCLEWCCPGTW